MCAPPSYPLAYPAPSFLSPHPPHPPALPPPPPGAPLKNPPPVPSPPQPPLRGRGCAGRAALVPPPTQQPPAGALPVASLSRKVLAGRSRAQPSPVQTPPSPGRGWPAPLPATLAPGATGARRTPAAPAAAPSRGVRARRHAWPVARAVPAAARSPSSTAGRARRSRASPSAGLELLLSSDGSAGCPPPLRSGAAAPQAAD